MKKSLSYLLFITAIVFSGIFTSCVEDSQLIGTWTDVDGDTVQFKEGGDCVLYGTYNGTYIETTSSITINTGGDEMVWNIESLTDNQLVVSYTYENYVLVYGQYQWVTQTETMTFTKVM